MTTKSIRLMRLAAQVLLSVAICVIPLDPDATSGFFRMVVE